MAQTTMEEARANLPARQEYGVGGGALQALDQRETASSAVAAQARAMVEARYVIALRRPRNWDQVRQDVMHECRRPSFANNKSAFYHKPIGAGVEGLGIRFVEMALRCMTNVLVETNMVYEDDLKEVHRVSVTDLESNVTYPLDIRVARTVERARPMDDGSYLSVRTNKAGKPTYTVAANDDDLLNKRGAQISKAMRTLGLRIIPGDIQDEAEALIKRIRLDEAAKDPDAARKRITDAFAEVGVKAADLVDYLGHGIDTCSPAELVNLRGIYGAIKDGEATWKSVIENKAEIKPEAKPESRTKPQAAPDKETVDQATGEVKVAEPPPPPPEPAAPPATQEMIATLDRVLLAIHKAATAEAVDEAVDLARSLSAQQRSLAEQAAGARKRKLETARNKRAPLE